VNACIMPGGVLVVMLLCGGQSALQRCDWIIRLMPRRDHGFKLHRRPNTRESDRHSQYPLFSGNCPRYNLATQTVAASDFVIAYAYVLSCFTKITRSFFGDA
jgi:hypothetical protein